MKITSETDPGLITDFSCDMCGDSTRAQLGQLQYGTIQATWGAVHCGEVYELHLCESCFFGLVSNVQRTRWVGAMFDDEAAQD